MKTETLFLLAGGAAALLWYLDQKQAAPVPAAAAPTQTPAPVLQIAAPASPQPAAPASPPVEPAPVIIQTLPFRGQRLTSDPNPILTLPVDIAQRQTGRVSTNPGSMAGIPIYGGWR